MSKLRALLASLVTAGLLLSSQSVYGAASEDVGIQTRLSHLNGMSLSSKPSSHEQASTAGNVTAHVSSSNLAQPGEVVKISGWVHSSQTYRHITLMLYRNDVPNSGLNFETSLRSDGSFSASIPIPSRLPDGDYSLIIFVPSNNGIRKVLQREIYIAATKDVTNRPEDVPVLWVLANPPLLGTTVRVEGWVTKSIPSLTLTIRGNRGEITRQLRVQSNGFFESEILLPTMLGYGKSEFVIKGPNDRTIVQRMVTLGLGNSTMTNATQNSPLKSWIQIISPTMNQTIQGGTALDIAGQLSRVPREPTIQVTLFQSVSSNYKERGVRLAQKALSVAASATFKGKLSIPRLDSANGDYFTLVFRYKWAPPYTVVLKH